MMAPVRHAAQMMLMEFVLNSQPPIDVLERLHLSFVMS